MSSRYPPLSGFNSRDRSPQRFGDRRPPVGPRGADDGNLPPLGREPPRGPKALIDPPRGGPFGGRGRGYPGRGDFRDRDRDLRDRDRDRDFRDIRDGPPPFRRDIDRDWSRRDRDFDPRESRIGFGRGRSRSPPRDFRDIREPPGRDPDLVRMRRGSRDSILSVSSNAPDGPPPGVGHHPRNGPIRGRGRGDWEGGRGRGRPPFLDDRDSFRRRSLSRDGWWDRERDRDRFIDRERERDRDRDRELDRRDREREMDRRDRFERRDELDRRIERDDRDRPNDLWKRDRPPSRTDIRPPVSGPNSIPQPPAAIPPGPAPSRALDFPPSEQPRKPSVAEARREADRLETLPPRPDPRPEPPKDLPPTKRSPPPAAPQVPAFGTALIPGLSTEKACEANSNGPPPPKLERSELPPRASMQPPTGPKADRGPPQQPLEQRIRRDDGTDVSGKQETTPRAKPSGPPSARKQTPELSPPTAPAAMAGKDAPVAHSESPSARRPSFSVTSPVFGRTYLPPGRATSPIPQTSPRSQYSSIPTGPRALQQRQPPTPRGPPKGSKQWVRPGYSRPATGANSISPHKRDSIDGKERTLSLSLSEDSRREPPHFEDKEETDDDEIEAGEIVSPVEPRESTALAEPRYRSPTPRDERFDEKPFEKPVEKPAGIPIAKSPSPEKPTQPVDDQPIPDFGHVSDEDEDENVVFTQDYLEERKQIFEKDMQALRAEMPLPPLEDPTIVALLIKIQLLGMIAHDVTEPAPEPARPAVTFKEPSEEPTPSIESKPEKEPKDQELPAKVVLESIPPAEVISIESLPFLNSGPPTPLSDLEVYQENIAKQDEFKGTFRAELVKRRKEIARKNAGLREEYLALYKPWRMEVWGMDRLKDDKTATPIPTPPPPPVLQPPTTAELRRMKGNSELDFQNALRASEISAQEELEKRRVKEATAKPDLGREAIIPDMFEPAEEKATIYKDVNNIVGTSDAKAVFGFAPPANDFTPEEHTIFTNAFMTYPKKWGKIAESLPGRDFQQCIIHYYLTKEEIKYKAKLNKRWSRRGRAKRSTRPKSNALMADLGVVKPDYEGEEETPAVTDTGRPKRAAAPTFGDSSADTDQVTNGRRAEQLEKPRRGRLGTGTRGGRRGKAAQHHQASLPPPDQQFQNPAVPVAGTMTALPKTELEPSLDGTSEAIMRVREPEREHAEPIPRAKAGRRAKEGMYAFESAEPDASASKQSEVGYGSLQPTSYWSVPEQRDFKLLLAHFGRDFEGISNFMKTKTTVMVKNYFQRRIDSGQKEFEDIVVDAEGKKARGEPTGPLPVPSVAPRRRYEATPSSIMHPRPLAPHGDPMDVDENRLPKGKHGLSPQPAPLHARVPEKERNRYPPLAQASTAPMSTTSLLSEESRMRSHAGLQQRMPGPRMGYFTEDRRESTVLPHATARTQEAQIPARQTPIPVPEMARMEPVHSQTLRPTNVDMHGSPLLPSQTTLPSSQQMYMQQPPLVASHSRHSSLGRPPGSPVQQRLEPEISPIRRDSVSQRPMYTLPGQIAQPPVLSPPKVPSRPGSTPAEPEAPRQVPAKRSNIMSILNDEPEEPQPRKRFAGEASSTPTASTVSPTRPAYSGMHMLLQQAAPSRQEESTMSQPKSSYGQQSQYGPPSRGYSDYQSYAPSASSTAPSSNDWMARFDPRGQQQQPPPQPLSSRASSALTPQPPYSPYASAQPQPGPSLTALTAPSPAASPAPSQRPSYSSSVFAQPSGSAVGSTREMSGQSQIYRSSVGSPPTRNSSLAYGSRQGPPTPIESPANLLSMSSRQPPAGTSYASPAQTTPAQAQPQPGGHQSYQQHVQTMVNGAHQQQAHRSALGLAGSQYGHSTPPPHAQSSRAAGLPGPSQSLSMGRSYTPPAVLQPNPAGGLSYVASGPSPAVGPVHPLHQRHPEAPAAPGHHRVYSQGSNAGPLAGPLTPQHPPR